MEFPDFLQYRPFNELREKMGAHRLGQFEFFNPKLHLSAEEKQQLQKGLRIDRKLLLAFDDSTLRFKNGRVLSFFGEIGNHSEKIYHIAMCKVVENVYGEIFVATVEPKHSPTKYNVCGDCLQILRYKGFDAVRNRHRYYSLDIQKYFNLEEYFLEFPLIPTASNKPKLPFLN